VSDSPEVIRFTYGSISHRTGDDGAIYWAHVGTIHAMGGIVITPIFTGVPRLCFEICDAFRDLRHRTECEDPAGLVRPGCVRYDVATGAVRSTALCDEPWPRLRAQFLRRARRLQRELATGRDPLWAELMQGAGVSLATIGCYTANELRHSGLYEDEAAAVERICQKTRRVVDLQPCALAMLEQILDEFLAELLEDEGD
jgi:hypothetical protein